MNLGRSIEGSVKAVSLFRIVLSALGSGHMLGLWLRSHRQVLLTFDKPMMVAISSPEPQGLRENIFICSKPTRW
jgi:hypothetical protein